MTTIAIVVQPIAIRRDARHQPRRQPVSVATASPIVQIKVIYLITYGIGSGTPLLSTAHIFLIRRSGLQLARVSSVSPRSQLTTPLQKSITFTPHCRQTQRAPHIDSVQHTPICLRRQQQHPSPTSRATASRRRPTPHSNRSTSNSLQPRSLTRSTGGASIHRAPQQRMCRGVVGTVILVVIVTVLIGVVVRGVRRESVRGLEKCDQV